MGRRESDNAGPVLALRLGPFQSRLGALADHRSLNFNAGQEITRRARLTPIFIALSSWALF
jgi:hypothetical protein